MSNGVEVRAPFLDSSVLEFAASLPVRDRVRGLVTKAFLKTYAKRYLPADIAERRKRGLSVPLAKWLRGPLEDWARERLRSSRLTTIGIADDAAVRLFQEHRSRTADHTRAIWSLAVLDVWLENLSTHAHRVGACRRTVSEAHRLSESLPRAGGATR
jgi:asparagine synthase (glutamine-hydrolysing)